MDWLNDLVDSSLFGIMLGSILTLIITLIINKLNRAGELEKNIAQNRIDAYVNLNKLLTSCNIYLFNESEKRKCAIFKNQKNKYNTAFCFPSIFADFETFMTFKKHFSSFLSENKIYIDKNLFLKLFFLDSYLGQLYKHIRECNALDINYIGYILADEFENLVYECSIDVQKFFTKKYKQKNKVLKKFEPYDYECKRYKKTLLFQLLIKRKHEICKTCQIKSCYIHKIKKS